MTVGEVQAQLGHSSASLTTDVYTHVQSGDVPVDVDAAGLRGERVGFEERPDRLYDAYWARFLGSGTA